MIKLVNIITETNIKTLNSLKELKIDDQDFL